MKKLLIKIIFWSIAGLFLLLNLIAFMHAYSFTHFSDTSKPKTKISPRLSLGEKLSVLFLGIKNPRPVNTRTPSQKYITVTIPSNVDVECWHIPNEAMSKGTVILFHGYGGAKSSLIPKSDLLLSMGYNTLLVDFMGAGGSQGNTCGIGYLEAEQVKSCVAYISKSGEKNIILSGMSMGAAAIMKALSDTPLLVSAIIIECPYARLLNAVQNRFEIMNVPTFPAAELLVFWGGIQNDFNAFDHNPVDYATNIKCPTLLIYGAKDDRVKPKETERIYKALSCKKKLKIFLNAGHDDLAILNPQEWKDEVEIFLDI